MRQYGFVADANKTNRHNAYERLANLPTWFYHSRPSHSAFHDFTSFRTPPKYLHSLLGLGLKFIPTPRYTHKWCKIQDNATGKIRRSLQLKFFFAHSNNSTTSGKLEYNPRMYVNTGWLPPPSTYPSEEMDDRLANFDSLMQQYFRQRRGKTNLMAYQHRALSTLQAQDEFLIVPCDKNLGPSIIETERYVGIAYRDHLNCRQTYQLLTDNETQRVATFLTMSVGSWIETYSKQEIVTRMEKKFLSTHLSMVKDPFARFYVTLKVHKLKPGQGVDDLKSRPIVSCPGSVLHPLGIWVDDKLQKVSQQQPSYFKNNYTLKQLLLQLNIPPNARLFIADARSMYTNIPTTLGINTILKKLRKFRDEADLDYPVGAVISALKLVMKNNIFRFNGQVFKQVNGTAMGTPPAPPYATLYFGAHEDEILPQYHHNLLFYKRFIDDVFGIWLCDPDPVVDDNRWLDFQADMNRDTGLTWDFSEKVTELDFMDMHLTIVNDCIVTSLYEKPLNLHLYIPPHSAHPPGLLPGIVYGSLFRIHTLCSDAKDKQQRTQEFYNRLIIRGYQPSTLIPLFQKAIMRSQTYCGPVDKSDKTKHSVILHLPYHPQDPHSQTIQRAWNNCVAEPHGRTPLADLINPCSFVSPEITRMIIAYSRPRNLGNLLTHRKFRLPPNGPPASSYYNPVD